VGRATPRLPRGASAAAEVALLFLPAIPAYLWMWPAVTDTAWLTPVQVAVYLYLLAGTLLIGRHRWNLRELGLNRRGIGLSLACGALFIAMSVTGRLALNLPMEPRPAEFWRLAGEIAYYFVMVGFVEELLFRGLLYRALDEWRGVGFAILVSSLGFGVYHLWQGPMGIFGCFVTGLLFGAVRWRAGGIVGLIVVHGLVDLVSVELWPNLTAGTLTEIRVTSMPLAIVSDALFVALIVCLWKAHPRILRGRKDEP
jgi:membrane protease YdiL (CAAX protease family)